MTDGHYETPLVEVLFPGGPRLMPAVLRKWTARGGSWYGCHRLEPEDVPGWTFSQTLNDTWIASEDGGD